jgi:hypothetical protein
VSRPLLRLWDSEWFDLAIAMATPLLLLPMGLLDMPPTIDRLTIDNRSVYDLHVAVSGRDDDDRWLLVTTVGRGSTTTTYDLIDQGDVWRFRFRGQGRAGGEVVASRADLEAASWHLTVPAEVGERLAEQGAPPSPP